MVNELRQPHFYKPNVLAMLNTLFPPSMGEPPKGQALQSVLHRHRASLYHIILAVESGKRKPLEEFAGNLRIGTTYSWPETRLQLEKYLELAESQIVHAGLVEEIEFIPPLPDRSPERTYSPLSSPITTPFGSWDRKKSLPGSPRIQGGISNFRKGHSRNLSKSIFIRDLDPNEPKAIRSAPLAERTPNLRRPTLSTPGHGFDTITVSSAGTPRLSTQSGSPPKQVPFEVLRIGPFETETPEPAFLKTNDYTDIDIFKAPISPMLSTPTDPYEIRHQRTNSSGKVRYTHSAKPSVDLPRPLLRRDSSALRNVESIEDVSTNSIGRPYEDNPLPTSSPPKLNRMSSFGERFLRKVKSTTSLKDQPARDPTSVGKRGPPLTHKQSKTKESDEVHGSHSFSKNDTFGRRSANPHRSSTAKGGNPLGILFGASSESFMNYGQNRNPSRASTPQGGQNNFTAMKNESAPNLRQLERRSSESRLSSAQPDSPPDFGSPNVVDLQQPFKAYKLPTSKDDLDTFANPSIRKQKSTSFLYDMRRSKSKTPKLTTSDFATSPFVGLDVAVRNKLKKKSSMPTLGFFSSKKSKAAEANLETNDQKERVIMLQNNRSTKSLRKSISPTKSTSPVPPTPTLSTPARSLRLVKSQASLGTSGTVTPKGLKTGLTTTPTRKLFRKFSREKIITSSDITEPFPDALRKSFSSTVSKAQKHQSQFAARSKEYDMPSAITSPDLYNLPPYAPGGTGSLTRDYIPPTNETLEEFHRKEYLRKWFLEESRARRYELGGPKEMLPLEEVGLGRLKREEWPRVEGRRGKRVEGEKKKGWFEFGGWLGRREEGESEK